MSDTNDTNDNFDEDRAEFERFKEYTAMRAEVQAEAEKLQELRVRVLKDEEGEVFANLTDLKNFLDEWIPLQGRAMGYSGEEGHYVMQGVVAAANNIFGFLSSEDQQIDAATAADVPDTIPQEWLA